MALELFLLCILIVCPRDSYYSYESKPKGEERMSIEIAKKGWEQYFIIRHNVLKFIKNTVLKLETFYILNIRYGTVFILQ